MKKALSALLSVLLLLGCMNCLFFGTAVSAATVTRNYDFEGLTNADLAGLVQTGNCTAEIDESGVFGTGNALKVTLPAKQNEVGSISFTGIKFTAGHTYKISFNIATQAVTSQYVNTKLYSGAVDSTTATTTHRWFDKNDSRYTSNKNANGAVTAIGGAYMITTPGQGKVGAKWTVPGTVEATETGTLNFSAWNSNNDDSAVLYLDNLVVEETADDTDLGTETKYDFENVADLADLVQTGNCTAEIDESGVFGTGNALKVTLPAKQNEVGSISFTGIKFTAGHTYKISFNIATQAVTSQYVNTKLYSGAVDSTTATTTHRWFDKNDSRYTSNKNANGAVTAIGGAYMITTPGQGKVGAKWTVPGTVEATETGTLNFSAWNSNNDDPAILYLDNLVVEEQVSSAAIEKTVASEFEFEGTSIRTTGTQALRFKTQVNKATLEGSYSGYQITEYGFLVFRKDYMEENAELTVDTAKTDTTGKTVKALKKAAYVKGETDIVFDETDAEKLFTAALFNIKEENYNVKYAVRTYAVLEGPRNTQLTVYVTDTQSYSVNETAGLAFEAMGNAYTDADGNSWAESYETRSYLYENILKNIEGGNYTAPAQPKA